VGKVDRPGGVTSDTEIKRSARSGLKTQEKEEKRQTDMAKNRSESWNERRAHTPDSNDLKSTPSTSLNTKGKRVMTTDGYRGNLRLEASRRLF
jgi:hypothetical protein